MTKRVKVLGVSIDPLTRSEVLDRLTNVITAKLPTQVVTVNPEFLVRAQRDPTFQRVLNSAEIAIPDGVGIRAAATFGQLRLPPWRLARFVLSLVQGLGTKLAILMQDRTLQRPIPQTVTGVDLIWELARRGDKAVWRFYLVGAEPGIAQRAAERLKTEFPGLVIVGAEEGIPHGRFEDQILRRELATKIGRARPDILLVAFGAPKQDLFLAEQRDRLNASVMMGVGGSFDFIAHTVPRAPQLLQSLGLEWLWRLLHQPWRARRIWNAVVVFPWLVFWKRQRRKNR